MKQTIKTISFTILILSLGLVLSACNKEENQEVENDGEMIHESSQQEDQEVISNEEIDSEEVKEEEIDLDLAKWRDYDNEYFNLKFKYHNNWYFQRDNLNADNYLAVYGFAPSSEELNNKDYVIQLFILDDQNFLEKDFVLVKEKQGQNKKYILVSNNEEYQNILKLMFENIEFLDEENNLNTYTNEEYGFSLEYPDDWEVESNNNSYKVKKTGDQKMYSKNIENSSIFYFPHFSIGVHSTDMEDISEYIEKQRKSSIEEGIGVYPNILKNTKVDNLKAVWLTSCIEMSSNQGPVVLKDGYVYYLTIPFKCIYKNGPDDIEDPDFVSYFNELDGIYGPTLNKILSTFKFTN